MPQDFCGLSRSAERRVLNVHERTRDELRPQKDGAKKRPLRRAAKFREETPRKGGGFTAQTVIPRRNNMQERGFVRKDQSITIPDKTPQKRWENMTFLPQSSATCHLSSHVCGAVNQDAYFTKTAPISRKAFSRSPALDVWKEAWFRRSRKLLPPQLPYCHSAACGSAPPPRPVSGRAVRYSMLRVRRARTDSNEAFLVILSSSR